MRFDRFDRYRQLASDLLVGQATSNEPENLLLAGSELIEFGIGGRGDRSAEGVQHETGQAGREHGVAIRYPAHRIRSSGAIDLVT